MVELATAADCTVNTIVHFEKERPARASTINTLKTVLEAAGIAFLGASGVQLQSEAAS